MHAAKLIGRYEEWCDRRLPVDPDARAEKHRRMAASAFAFLRASYPVWLDRFSADAAHDAPSRSAWATCTSRTSAPGSHRQVRRSA